MTAVPYIFDANQDTPQTLANRRAVAQAMLMSSLGRAPQNVGEGLTAIGRALAARAMMDDVDQRQSAALASARSDLAGAFGGGFPAAPASGDGSGAPSPAAASPYAGLPDGPKGQEAYAQPPVNTASGDLGQLTAMLADPSQRATLPAGMRNNNPGNIKYVGQRVPGIVGPSQNTDQGDPQAVFDSPQDGMSAMVGLLRRKYNGGMTTPNDIIAGHGGWTPGNYQAAANVARTAGIRADQDINFNDPTSAARFVRGLVLQEHGPSSKLYPDSLIMSALGGTPPQAPAAAAVTALANGQTPQTQVASLDPSAGLPADAGAPDLPTQAPIPQGRPAQIDMAQAAPGNVPMSAAGQQLLTDPHALSGNGVVQALAAANPPAPAAQPSPVTQALAAQSQAQPAAAAAAPSAGAQQVAQALASQQGDPNLPVMAGGSADAMTPQDMQGAQSQAMMRALSNPFMPPAMQEMLMARMMPHGIEMVDLGNGDHAEIDKVTGRQVGIVHGQRPPVLAGYDQRLLDQNGNQIGGGSSNGQPPYRFMTTDEKQAAGLPLDTPIQIGPDGKMVSNGVTVNTGTPETQYSDKMAGGLAAQHVALATGVPAAQEQLRDVHAMQAAVQQIKQNGGTTGMGQPEIMKLQSAINTGANLLGVDQPFDISDKEFLSKFNRQIAGAQAKSAAGARVTNFELKNYLSANPGLEMSPQGNERLLGIQSQILQRNIDVGQAINDATANAVAVGRKVNPAQIEELIRNYDAGHHITDPITGQDLTQDVKLKDLQAPGANGGAPAMRPRATNPQTGQSVEWDGTKWVPAQ